jgi:hypothetical protein
MYYFAPSSTHSSLLLLSAQQASSATVEHSSSSFARKMTMFRLVTGLLALASLALSTTEVRQPLRFLSEIDCDGQVGDPRCACLELSQAVTHENGTLFPSDGAVYNDFEDEN